MNKCSKSSNSKNGPYSFKQVDKLKYLGVNINIENSMYNKIQLINTWVNIINKVFFLRKQDT
jgi:hypothetical protein